MRVKAIIRGGTRFFSGMCIKVGPQLRVKISIYNFGMASREDEKKRGFLLIDYLAADFEGVENENSRLRFLQP